MSLTTIRHILLTLFVFFTAGALWSWGTEGMAGFFGFAFVIAWFCEVAMNNITYNGRPAFRDHDRRER